MAYKKFTHGSNLNTHIKTIMHDYDYSSYGDI